MVKKRTVWSCSLSYGRRGHSPRRSPIDQQEVNNQGYSSLLENEIMSFLPPSPEQTGKLNTEEFVLAMHLCELGMKGEPLPAALPVR
jgi:hypothetical protein